MIFSFNIRDDATHASTGMQWQMTWVDNLTTRRSKQAPNQAIKQSTTQHERPSLCETNIDELTWRERPLPFVFVALACPLLIISYIISRYFYRQYFIIVAVRKKELLVSSSNRFYEYKEVPMRISMEKKWSSFGMYFPLSFDLLVWSLDLFYSLLWCVCSLVGSFCWHLDWHLTVLTF